MNTKEMKNYILENKKKIIISLIALLVITLCIIATPYILKSNGKAEADNKKIEKQVEDKKTALEKEKKTGDKKEVEEAEKKQEKAKEESKEASKATKATSTAKAVASKPATSKPATSSTPKPAPAKPAPAKPAPAKQKVWVVDTPAWTETVTEVRKEKVDKYYCNGKYFDTYNEGYEYYISDEGEGNLGTVTVEVDVPYTYTVTHQEKGHYEYK